MIFTNKTCNATEAPATAKWTFVPVFAVTIFIAVIITNVPVLVQLLRKSHLRTSFNMYLMNLLFVNILQVILQNPLDIIDSLYSRWWMGSATCDLYIYANYVLAGIVMISHVIIAMNRIWAVTFPVQYRHKHTKAVAGLVCVSSWIWIHVLILPGIVNDALYYRRPIECYGCQVNNAAQPKWAMAMHWLVYVAPTPFILASFPYVVIKQMRQKRLVRSHSTHPDTGHNDKRTSRNGESASVKDETGTDPSGNRQSGWKRSKGMVIFALLTASIFVTWTPGRVYFSLKLFTTVDSNVAFQICYVLFACQAALDPLLFVVALKDLRFSFAG